MSRKDLIFIAGLCLFSGIVGGVVSTWLTHIDVYANIKETTENKSEKKAENWTPGTKGWDVSGRYIFSSSTDSVGIGTISPAYKLDVQGTGRYTGVLTIGAYTLPNTEGTGTQVLKRNGVGTVSWQDDATGGGGGTVTSVGLALPGEFTVTNSPVTGSGTLTGAWNSQTAKYVFAAPNAVAGVPTFRALVVGDLPSETGTVTSISQGTGMSFSVNPITTTGTINLANTAVTAGSYTNTTLTVDAQGRLTAASSGADVLTLIYTCNGF